MRRRPGSVIVTLVLVAAGALAAPPGAAGVATPPTVAAVGATAPAAEVTGAVAASRTFELGQAVDHVAAYWVGRSHARVRLAFSPDGIHFGSPVRAGRDDLGRQRPGRMTYGLLRSAPNATMVRVTSDRPIRQLTVLGLSDPVSPEGPAAAVAAVDRPAAVSATGAGTTQPAVVSRAGWGADPALMTWAPQFYATKKLVVHHTDTSNDYTDQAGAQAQIRSIYYYHSVTQGWGDIGYNFLIDKFGTIYEGRYSRNYAGANPTGDDPSGNGVTGAHTGGWNSGTVGVALLGTFTNQDITPAARQALEDLLAWEAARNGIDPLATQPFVNPVSGATITTPNIAGHRDYAATLCPGDAFYGTLPTIRADVAARTGAAPAPAPADTTAPTTPTNVSASGGRNRVSLAWSASTDDVGVSGYQVWRSKTSGSGYTQVASVTSTSYVNSSLARRTTYYYKVRAYDAAGNTSAFSAVVAARTN